MVCLLPTLFISLAIQESPPYSRQRRYKAKTGKGQKKTSLSVCFFFCRCCYSCKQKSRHPIIPVGQRERETGPSPASPLPSPPKKRKQNWQGYHLSKAWIVVRAHHYSLQVPLTVLHTRRCSVFPKLYPIPKLFSFLLSASASLSVFLPCPATPNSKLCLSRPSQGLRFLSVLSCLVLSVRAHDDIFYFLLFLDTDTNLSRNRPYRNSILSAPS